MPPTVTVIIPTYNRARFISAAIDSVVSQTFQDFELIVVDDGSTDDTVAIVNGYGNPRIRVLACAHEGLCRALNTALRHAQGQFIARLDSDDIWLPTFLATMITRLREAPHTDVVYAVARAMDEEGRPLSALRGSPLRYPADAFCSLLYRDVTCNIAVVATKRCLEAVGGFDETMRWNEDWDVWLRVAMHHRFTFIDQVVAQYREHADSMTREHGVQVAEQRGRVLEKAFALDGLSPRAQALRPIAYRNLYFDLGFAHLARRQYRAAASTFRRAVQVSRAPVSSVVRLGYCTALFYGGNRPSMVALQRMVARVHRNLRTRA